VFLMIIMRRFVRIMKRKILPKSWRWCHSF